LKLFADVIAGLGAMIRMRYTAIISISVIFVIILTAHVYIDRRSEDVFLQELRTHASQNLKLIQERFNSRLDRDKNDVETFAFQAQLQSQRSPQQIGRLVETYQRKAAHVSAIGLYGQHNLHVEHRPIKGISKDHITEILQRETSLNTDVDGDGFIKRTAIKSLGQGNLLIYHSITTDRPDGRGVETMTAYFVLNPTAPSAAVSHHLSIFHQVDSEGFVYALREKGSPSLLFGDPRTLASEPMTVPIYMGDFTWEILAEPINGWSSAPKIHENFSFALALSAIGTLLPVLIAALLLTERNGNIDALKLREAKLTEVTQRFNLAMESSKIGLWEMSAIDGHIFMDPRAASLHGHKSEDHYSTIADWMVNIQAQDHPIVEAFLFNCACSNQTHWQVYQITGNDGAIRYLRSAGANHVDAGNQVRTIGITWDVTADMVMASHLREAKLNTDIKNAELELALEELSRREHQLEELSGRLNLALESYNCGTWQIDPYNITAIWDDRMYQLYDLDRDGDNPVDLKSFVNCIHPDDRNAVVDTGTHAGHPATHRVLTRSGDIRYIRTVGQSYRDRLGKKRVVGIAFDITGDMILSEQLKQAKDEAEAKNAELELAKTRIEHNALHDPLTSLANRRMLDLELDRITKSSEGTRQSFAILHLDLDRFKQINDTLGHAAGDAMLEHTSRILKDNIRAGDLVARIGGDEFVILVEDFSHLDNIKAMATRIIAELNLPMIYNHLPCRCGVSIGIAFGNGLNVDSRAVLINADIALYRAKALGRNRFEFFTKNLQAEIIQNKRTADEILTGLERNEFEAWYQPQICARTQKLVGAEALVRWRHPERGILTPDQFLKVAEELNVVAQLDSTVLRAGLVEKRLWDLAGLDIAKLSVNVSARRLHDAQMLESLTELQIQPGEVAFELVESIFLDDIDKLAVGNIDALKRLGIDIEIDDFGTGHTSIISLLKLKPKRLKIDRQLVTPIITSDSERKLVRSIIEIAGSLGIETVAEGVETPEHAEILSSMGCDVLQGYLFSKPLPAQDFIRFARKEEWRIAS
jgi:diguanylate cyclase (GGDEF)-like protein